MAAENISAVEFVPSIVASWNNGPSKLIEPVARLSSLSILPLHVYQALAFAAFYYVLYRHVSPRLAARLAPDVYPKLAHRLQLDWNICTVSLTQSVVNGLMGVILILSNADWNKMSWQERVWGYQPRMGTALAISTGYFIYHFLQSIVHVRLEGSIFVYHSIACIIICSIGFVCSFHFIPSDLTDKTVASACSLLYPGFPSRGSAKHFP
jgi:hypothetical protein